MSPYERRMGVPPRQKLIDLKGKLFCKCLAKVYDHGKWEKAAVPCIYMGLDPRTPGVLVRRLGDKKDGLVVRSAQVVSYLDEFPYVNPQVPRPRVKGALEYASDSEQEDEDRGMETVVLDGNGDVLEEEAPNPLVESDSDTDDESNIRSKIGPTDDVDGHNCEDEPPPAPYKVGNEDAWEVEEIIGERMRKRKGRRYKEYRVKWKGDWDPTWEHYNSLAESPEVKAAWERKKAARLVHLNLVNRTVHQMVTGEPEKEMVPIELTPENPFKHLFDINKRPRVAPPVGEKAMLNHEFKDYFIEARTKEKLQNQHWKAYVEVPRASVPPGTKILRTTTVYDIKYNKRGEIEKFKTRVCVDGSRTIVSADETYENIASFNSIRFLLCFACRYNLELMQTDVKNFFLQARMPKDKEYYCEIPDGWAENDPKTHVAKILAPWYGLKESAKIAGDQLAEVLVKECGMTENEVMPKIFFKWDGDDFIACGIHIDDAVWITTSMTKLEKLLDESDKHFQMERTPNPSKLLGVEILYDRNKGVMKIHQGSYHRAKLQELGKKTPNRKVNSPGYIPSTIANPSHPNSKMQASDVIVKDFQKRIGIQMWALQTDPSSMYVVHKLAGSMLNPSDDDRKALSRVEDYRATHPDIGVVFRRAKDKQVLKKGMSMDCLIYYADADLAGDKQDSKSISGYCAYLGDSGMFDWKSKKQTCVCQSSCESEVYACKECTCHAIWMREALTLMGFTFTEPTPICQDNRGAIALCKSDKHHSRTRHFRMHVALLRDCREKRITVYPWVPTKLMRGDLFNKAHGPARHQELCAYNGIDMLSGIDHLLPEQADHDIWNWEERVKEEKKC